MNKMDKDKKMFIIIIVISIIISAIIIYLGERKKVQMLAFAGYTSVNVPDQTVFVVVDSIETKNKLKQDLVPIFNQKIRPLVLEMRLLIDSFKSRVPAIKQVLERKYCWAVFWNQAACSDFDYVVNAIQDTGPPFFYKRGYLGQYVGVNAATVPNEPKFKRFTSETNSEKRGVIVMTIDAINKWEVFNENLIPNLIA